MGKLPQMPRPLYIAYRVAEMLVSIISRTYNAVILYLITGSGSTHQTTSARCYIEHLPLHRAVINAIFFWQDDHCEWAWRREVEEARKTLERAKSW